MTHEQRRAAGHVTGEAIPMSISSVLEDDAQQNGRGQTQGGGMDISGGVWGGSPMKENN